MESFKDLNTKKIFEDILRLFIAYTMYKEADYFRSVIGDEEFDKIPSTITSLCGRLREEAILLTDSLPFPDKVMGVWGTKDLDVLVYIILNNSTQNKYEWWNKW